MPPSGSGTYSTYAPYQFNDFVIVFEGNAVTRIFTGIYLVVTGINIYLLRQKRTHNILLLYTTIQLVLIILYVTMGLYVVPGQALAIFGITDPESNVDTYLYNLSKWPSVIQDASSILNTCLSDGFLLYRCYHITRTQNKYTWTFSALLYFAAVGSSFAWLIVNSLPGASFSDHAVQITGICYTSLSAAMNIFASCLISVRLWKFRRQIRNVGGLEHEAFYISYIAMTLESALLYTIFVIIALIVFLLGSPLEFVFIPSLGIVEALAPSLIVYRIARGISFEVDEYGSMAIGTIRFALQSDQLHVINGVHSIHPNGSDVPSGAMPDVSLGNAKQEDRHVPELCSTSAGHSGR